VYKRGEILFYDQLILFYFLQIVVRETVWDLGVEYRAWGRLGYPTV